VRSPTYLYKFQHIPTLNSIIQSSVLSTYDSTNIHSIMNIGFKLYFVDSLNFYLFCLQVIL